MRRSPAWAVVRSGFAGSHKLVAAAVTMTCVHQVCEAATPVLVGLAIDNAVATGDKGGILLWIAAIAGVYVILSAAGNGAVPVAARALSRAEHDLRLAVVGRVLDPRGMRTARAPGTTLSIASSDAHHVGTAVDGAASAMSGLAALLVAGAALFFTSVTLGLVALGCVVIVVFVVPILGRPLHERSDAEQEAVAQTSGLAVDLIDGLRVLTGIGARRTAGTRFAESSQSTRAARISAAYAEGAFESVTGGIAGLLLVAVAGVGAHLTLDGSMTAGEFVAGVGLAQFLLEPVGRLAYAGADFARVRASAGRIATLLAEPYAVADGDRAGGDPAARLEVTDLGGDALTALTLSVAPGEFVGVAIEDGSAARELLDALARWTDPARGTVRLGGVPVSELRLADLRRVVAVVPHHAQLFTESVADIVGDDGEPALAAAAAGDVAAALSDGGSRYRGLTLSGGERQRIALARALAADPPVLVLDEPTTALDATTEMAVAERLRGLRAGRTTLVVSTSAGLLSQVDRVVLVTGGRVVAAGRHAELLDDPRYAAVVLG